MQRPSLFIGIDYLLNNILFLAEHAGPLEQFKRDVTKFLGRELIKKEGSRASVLLDKVMTMGNREGTFVQCLAIGLDRTIRTEYEVYLLPTDIEDNKIQEGKVYVQVKSNKQLKYIVKTAATERFLLCVYAHSICFPHWDYDSSYY